jgi:hypothetical protein
MVVKIGHAKADENGKAKGGLAGDQTNQEVVIQDWYLRTGGWSKVFRAKEIKVSEAIAKAMEQACANNNIGYDQDQRTTLYEKAKEVNWNLLKITTKCECDCSSLVAVCANAAGVSVNKNMYTGNQEAVLLATQKFKLLTEPKYLIKPDYLKRGDILLGPGHTAIVLSDGIPYSIESAKSFSAQISGTYRVAAPALNVRQGAGVIKSKIITIPEGTKVNCYGYYTKVLNTNWLYIQFILDNKQYTGFASAKYLVK